MKNFYIYLKKFIFYILGIFGVLLGIGGLTISYTTLSVIITLLFILLSILIFPVLWKYLKNIIKPKIFIIIYIASFIIMFIVDHGTEPIKEKNTTSYVTASSLNVRKGIGQGADISFKLTKGDSITVLKDTLGWALISSNKGNGYVSKDYISNDIPLKDKSSGKIFYILSGIVLLSIVLYILIPTSSTKRYNSQEISRPGVSSSSAYKSSKAKAPNGSSSGKTKPATESISPGTSPPIKVEKVKKSETYFLTIKDGVVNLGKENSSIQMPVFRYFDKAIDCDLEDPKDEKSRFLVVTTKGEVILCKLKHTSKDYVFRPFVTYGKAYKAKFVDANSFIFHTEKGTYKGFFNSTRKELLSKR
jgi:uncharacterized protein YgiM (DUF1202 family)